MRNAEVYGVLAVRAFALSLGCSCCAMVPVAAAPAQDGSPLATQQTRALAEESLAPAKPVIVSIDNPKPFGHFIGGVLKRRVAIRTDAREVLLEATLPQPGRVTYWLDLRRVAFSENVTGGVRMVELSLDYQTFYAPLDPKQLVLPAVTVQFGNGNGEEATSVTVPPFTFLSSPLREVVKRTQVGAGSEAAALQLPNLMADQRSRPRSTALERSIAGFAFPLLLMSAGLLAHHFSIWPFGARKDRPFTIAARRIAALASNQECKPEACNLEVAFKELHRAFDASAGRRVLASDVEEFVSKRVGFAPGRDAIFRFYGASREMFFARNTKAAQAMMPMARLKLLAARLAAYERAAL